MARHGLPKLLTLHSMLFRERTTLNYGANHDENIIALYSRLIKDLDSQFFRKGRVDVESHRMDHECLNIMMIIIIKAIQLANAIEMHRFQ